jgi:hypothetical protein
MGNPETAGNQTGRSLSPLSKDAYKFDGTEYQSIVSRIKLKLPRIGQEKTVSIREAVVFKRPDGQVATSHVLFAPNPWGPTYDTNLGASAVVVTRLREDRSKERDSVLSKFEPPSAAQREQHAKVGILYARVPSSLGESLRRIIRNRVFDEPFPYQTRVLNIPDTRSVGVSRFLVVEDDSLLEFSQIFPCGALKDEECTQKAVLVSDAFVEGVSQFLTFPKDPQK